MHAKDVFCYDQVRKILSCCLQDALFQQWALQQQEVLPLASEQEIRQGMILKH